MKFRTKKFLIDREKSLERSKKGELELIYKSTCLPTHEDIKQKFKVYNSPNLDAIINCKHRNKDIFETSVCNIPIAKRTIKDLCVDCDLKLS